jgi:hypothetical protein
LWRPSARIPPGQEKVDAILGDEVSVSKKSEDLVPEEDLCLVGVDEGPDSKSPQSRQEKTAESQ